MPNNGARVVLERHDGGWKWEMTVRGRQLDCVRNESTLVKAAEAAENTLYQIEFSKANGQRV